MKVRRIIYILLLNCLTVCLPALCEVEHSGAVNRNGEQKHIRSVNPFAQPSLIAFGAYPDLAFDKDGCAHLVYVRDGTLRYRKRKLKDKSWSVEIDTGILKGMVHRSDPEVTVDTSGRIHVLVGSTYAWLDGGRWNRIEGAFKRDTDLAVNSAGDVFVVRRGGHDSGFLGLLKRSAGTNQFEALPDPDVSGGFRRGRNDHVYGSIAVNPVDDSLHIVYRHATPKKISYRVSTDGGGSWQGGGITDNEPEAPDITISENGQVYVANADGYVFRKGDRPSEWIDIGRAFEGARRSLPRIEAGSYGAVHVVAFGGQYNRFFKGRWYGVRNLPSRRGKKLGYADLAVRFDGTVWIVYEEGDAVQREEPSGPSDILLVEISKPGS
jgi:hypothetical protein